MVMVVIIMINIVAVVVVAVIVDCFAAGWTSELLENVSARIRRVCHSNPRIFSNCAWISPQEGCGP